MTKESEAKDAQPDKINNIWERYRLELSVLRSW